MSETHITSLLVHVRPERMDEVRMRILAAGAEIPIEDPAGKIVAVFETENENLITRFADCIAVAEGVIAANMVFHLIDDVDAEDALSAATGGS